ncbi:hypothetical protein SSP531S_04230 [Streptomyces spongiicola]|uniref:Uncharacterized protein n=1 Tax=Streptomyces spongiicola TaxID=1690221 RepID=A0A388SR39_9ACTN|nr:hypothetical protein SSP531S_04230 [Streptomyces spongiicola]
MEGDVKGELDGAERQYGDVEPAPCSAQSGPEDRQDAEDRQQCARVRKPAAGGRVRRGAQQQGGTGAEQTASGPPQPASRSAHPHKLSTPYACAEPGGPIFWPP